MESSGLISLSFLSSLDSAAHLALFFSSISLHPQLSRSETHVALEKKLNIKVYAEYIPYKFEHYLITIFKVCLKEHTKLRMIHTCIKLYIEKILNQLPSVRHVN